MKYNFSKITDTRSYISEVLKDIGCAEIIGVHANPLSLPNKNSFSYMQDTPVYIMFDNGKCLVIDYMFIDELQIEYRKMTDEEIRNYNESEIKDCFNRNTNIYDSSNTDKLNSINCSSLKYGRLTSIDLTPIVEKYSAWSHGDIIEREPTEETFGRMTFNMDNGKTFCIEPGTAWDDGYSFLWSNDAIEEDKRI